VGYARVATDERRRCNSTHYARSDAPQSTKIGIGRVAIATR